MLPLASTSGYAVIGGAVAGSALLIWLLLRTEKREERARQAAGEGHGDAGSDGLDSP
jgi:hypothetical protein